MVNVVEASCDVGVYNPLFPFIRSSKVVDFSDGIMAAPSRSEAVATALEPCFPAWFQGIFDLGLKASVNDSWDSQWSEFATGFRYVHPSGWSRLPGLIGREVLCQSFSGCWCFNNQLIDSSRISACVHLRYPSHTRKSVSMASQHEFLERANFVKVARLCCPKDALS